MRKNSATIIFRLPPETKQRFRSAAEAQRRTMNGQLEMLVLEFVEASEAAQK